MSKGTPEMNEGPITTSRGMDEIREDLADQFVAAARRDRQPRRHRSRALLAVGAIAVALPASLALASGGDDTGDTFYWDGTTIFLNGNPIDCPADAALIARLGEDPCVIGTPAPAPKSLEPQNANDRTSNKAARREVNQSKPLVAPK